MALILVIDDEPELLESVQVILQLNDYTTIGATDSRLGIELARQHLPDLIVCDVMMPGHDGYAVLHELRSNTRTASVPFIFLTALGDHAALRAGMESGADDYLTKPFSPEQLISAITARLERHVKIFEESERKLTALRGNIVHLLPHELRTPLSAILGYSTILIEDRETLTVDDVFEMVGHINRAGKRLEHLVENFLLYAQIEIMKSNEKQNDLIGNYTSNAKTIIEAEALSKSVERERQGDLSMDVADASGLHISEESLRKVVEELIDNAFKFSKAGIPVAITGKADSDHYTLTIFDHGRGMSSDQIADIGAYIQFERRLYEQQGTGLGLAIAKGLVELHGGSLNIRSVYGEETQICVILPLLQEVSE